VGADNAGVGALVVPFEFGKAKDCNSTGVAFVRAELNTGKTVEGSCRRGRVRFDDLEPGPYTVTVYGLDQQGREIMDSLDRKPVRADVVGDDAVVVIDPPIPLVSAPAKLKLRWTFGFGSCQSDEIGAFAVTAWNIDQLTEQMTGRLNCLSQGDHVENYRVLPDPGRLLAGDQVGAADVQPLDQSDLPVGDRVSFTFPPPPAGGEIRLSLSCDEGGCRGTGAPDLDARDPKAIAPGLQTQRDGV
jgi:hypothetical protein